MALLTRHKCHCRQPHGKPGSTCRTCQGRVRSSSGSDDHPYQVTRTYTESYGPAFGEAYEDGRDAVAFAKPGGYSKRTTATGTDWFEAMAWGGSSGSSYAYAGSNDMQASAGLGGHAISVRGSGSRYEARLVGPEGKVIHRLPDGSIRKSKLTKIDENHRRTKHRDEINRFDEYDDEEIVPIKYKNEKRKAIEYSAKKHEGVKYGNDSRRLITWGT